MRNSRECLTEAEQEEVDDHLDSPPSAANSPTASASWRGFAFLESLASTGTVRLHRRRILKHTLSIHTHTLLQTQYLSIFVGKQIYSKYILYIQTLKH